MEGSCSAEAIATYTPEALEAARREEERRLVREGTEIWRARKEESLRQKQREQCELRRMLANYWPWGRPGGGAPCASALRKRNVPLEPSEQPLPPSAAFSRSSELLPQGWRTRSMMDRLRNDRSCNNSDRHIYDSYNHYESAAAAAHGVVSTMTPEKRATSRRWEDGGVELAPLLTSGRRLHDCRDTQLHQTQSTRHVATDATRPGYMIDSWRALNSGNRDYINELTEQIRQKQAWKMEERRRDGENCRQHFDTWRRLWGRPGHGAPIDPARRRNNLHDILYRTAAAAAVASGSTTTTAASVY